MLFSSVVVVVVISIVSVIAYAKNQFMFDLHLMEICLLYITALGCPSEFTHAESSGSPYCYGVLKHKITRQFAEFSCGQYAKNATAVMIPSQQEHEIIRAHLVEIAKKMGEWSSVLSFINQK